MMRLHRIELRADDHRHEDHQNAEEHEAGEDEWFHNYTLMFVIFWIAMKPMIIITAPTPSRI